jgi:hypothetical protein
MAEKANIPYPQDDIVMIMPGAYLAGDLLELFQRAFDLDISAGEVIDEIDHVEGLFLIPAETMKDVRVNNKTVNFLKVR